MKLPGWSCRIGAIGRGYVPPQWRKWEGEQEFWVVCDDLKSPLVWKGFGEEELGDRRWRVAGLGYLGAEIYGGGRKL